VSGLPETYVVIGTVGLTVFAIWWSEWFSKAAISAVIRVFRLGGRHGPVGAELARRMLAAAGEAGVTVDASILDSDFRRTFGDIDYQPKTGVLELTADKAEGATISSAGQVVMEVGRALQHRSGFPLVFAQRVLSPVVNFCGYAWIWPAFGANFAGMYLPENISATASHVLYITSTAMVGFLLLFVMMKVPLELDAARRGVSAMKRARVFSAGEAFWIRIFLGLILLISIFTTALVALNIFRMTARSN
jgi:Zn-dependent membrane protease YugP